MKRIIYLLGFMTTSFLTTNLNAQTASKTIVIDAGHGGSDVGSKNNAIVESQFTLEIAKKIQQLAKEKNIEVILTRDEDKIVDFENRLSKINSIKPDLVISLHVNNSQNRTTNGSEVFIYKNNTDEKTAQIGSDLAELISFNSIENRGLKKQNFRILRDSQVPAFLLELGFASNDKDIEVLKAADYQKQLAEKIVNYLENYKTI
ncbi:N-acetylmuramoyl-L-alanine amidase [Algoriella xinjiangensis]|uniref:N-acetylmuramoyl-L-alanine amidase n=1 Tax=Algoriella xinjiangensis TaxID=684065 RepID=A0A1I5A1X4_9FLAO|nr:N-acetylmuramoyl-L-alanine amidase [Algoriella xinjiangensis]SFN56229.1 N-acetylmuramoyl-L-alanine amidase [Algoriella xinjiangensis]VDH16396.1 Sporulation-specific N-acetylmuramoyl-L-alanine amidase [Algoriella xinjiangensis]